MPDDFETLTVGLRQWAATHDPHVRAAVELLIWKEWPRRGDFASAAIRRASGYTVIDWRAAREVHARTVASTSERAVLLLAVDLADNRYKLSQMGHAHARAMAGAFTAACAVDRG